MFESLSDRLQTALGGLRGKGKLTEADINATAREIRLALLEADVSLTVVRAFIKRVIGHNQERWARCVTDQVLIGAGVTYDEKEKKLIPLDPRTCADEELGYGENAGCGRESENGDGEGGWRNYMDLALSVAADMATTGEIIVMQSGEPIPDGTRLQDISGPIRLARGPKFRI